MKATRLAILGVFLSSGCTGGAPSTPSPARRPPRGSRFPGRSMSRFGRPASGGDCDGGDRRRRHGRLGSLRPAHHRSGGRYVSRPLTVASLPGPRQQVWLHRDACRQPWLRGGLANPRFRAGVAVRLDGTAVCWRCFTNCRIDRWRNDPPDYWHWLPIRRDGGVRWRPGTAYAANSTTIHVTAPPHGPGAVDVLVTIQTARPPGWPAGTPTHRRVPLTSTAPGWGMRLPIRSRQRVWAPAIRTWTSVSRFRTTR